MKRFSIMFLQVSTLALISCGGGDGPDENPEPANLTLEIDISDDRSGNVEITVTADNTIEYEIDPGDGEENIVTNSTGQLSYSYPITGIYTVEVKAYGSSGRFIRRSREINVSVGDSDQSVDLTEGYATPLEYPGLTLIWQDEFDGSSLDEGDWNYEIGTGSNGWGNNELQYYRRENTSVGDGVLTIEAKQENFSGRLYTSSRLTTQNKFTFTYGRVDIRAVLPEGQGFWPALWMLGSSFANVGWPASGEIDIMEMIGGGEGRDDTVHGTIHWDNNGSYACTCESNNSYQLSEGNFSDEFHVFTIIWDQAKIEWYVDDTLFKTVDITPGNLSELHNDFFFIFNVAVGGNWPGSPDGTSVFPQKMIVDYVRVFQ